MIPGLYSLFLQRLCEIKSKKEIIPFPLVFSKICNNFSITKEECWEMLLLFRDMEFIEIHTGHGIKILKREMSRKRELKLFAHNIPKSCINQCNKCNREFEAEITIQDTCKDCSREINKKIEEKIKKEIANGNTNPKWVIKLQELVKEYENKSPKQIFVP